MKVVIEVGNDSEKVLRDVIGILTVLRERRAISRELLESLEEDMKTIDKLLEDRQCRHREEYEDMRDMFEDIISSKSCRRATQRAWMQDSERIVSSMSEDAVSLKRQFEIAVESSSLFSAYMKRLSNVKGTKKFVESTSVIKDMISATCDTLGKMIDMLSENVVKSRRRDIEEALSELKASLRLAEDLKGLVFTALDEHDDVIVTGEFAEVLEKSSGMSCGKLSKMSEVLKNDIKTIAERREDLEAPIGNIEFKPFMEQFRKSFDKDVRKKKELLDDLLESYVEHEEIEDKLDEFISFDLEEAFDKKVEDLTEKKIELSAEFRSSMSETFRDIEDEISNVKKKEKLLKTFIMNNSDFKNIKNIYLSISDSLKIISWTVSK